MNQILITKNNDISYDAFFFNNNHLINKKVKNKRNYLIVFLLSIIICIVILIYFIFTFFKKINEQNQTNLLKEKYSINSLYSTNNNYAAVKLSNNISIIGLIEIPKINISYPILSNSDEDLLKISVCRFSGPLPNRIGNMCIAGHNYNNNLMFSRLNKLDIGDSIYITDLNNSRIEYIIYNKYRVKQSNLNCTENTNNVEITLITCNSNNNSERIVIKAKVKG